MFSSYLSLTQPEHFVQPRNLWFRYFSQGGGTKGDTGLSPQPFKPSFAAHSEQPREKVRTAVAVLVASFEPRSSASPQNCLVVGFMIKEDSKWEYVLALAYVNDLLITSTSQSGVEFIRKALSLKVKVTGRPQEDGELEFFGRLIKLDGNNIAVGVKPEYVRSVFTAFGWTEKDLEKVKPSATTPDIRAIYDAEDLEQPTKALSAEAAGRYRSCLGKIGWLTQT